MREAEEWGGGECSSGAAYPGLEVSRWVWGVMGSCSDVLGIWNTGEEEYSGNDNICGIRREINITYNVIPRRCMCIVDLQPRGWTLVSWSRRQSDTGPNSIQRVRIHYDRHRDTIQSDLTNPPVSADAAVHLYTQLISIITHTVQHMWNDLVLYSPTCAAPYWSRSRRWWEFFSILPPAGVTRIRLHVCWHQIAGALCMPVNNTKNLLRKYYNLLNRLVVI